MRNLIERQKFGDMLVKEDAKGNIGPSDVAAEMLKASGEVNRQCVPEVCYGIVKEGCIPNDWCRSVIVNVKGECS